MKIGKGSRNTFCKGESVMANDPVRYLVEHVALRDALFSAGPRVILDFMDNPGPAMIEL